MKIIRGLDKIKNLKTEHPVIVAIGTFDGVHIAHQKIIKKAVDTARRCKGISLVLTFYPHPMRITNPGNSPALLTSIEHRIALIEKLKPDLCLIVDFRKSFAGMSAEDFINRILIRLLHVKHIIVGNNFNFGKNRSGNINLLKKTGLKNGFNVDVIKSVSSAGKIISSSSIRCLIEQGRIFKASNLLGRRFSVLGTVVKGDSRGKVLGYPTANIDPHQEAVPPNGVYAIKAKINNRFYSGMLNIGKRPTFYKDAKKLAIEANIFDFNKYLYGQDIEIFFIKKIRNEKAFASAQLLKVQLKRDYLKTKVIINTVKFKC